MAVWNLAESYPPEIGTPEKGGAVWNLAENYPGEEPLSPSARERQGGSGRTFIPGERKSKELAGEPSIAGDKSSLGAFAETLTRLPENVVASAIMAFQGQTGASITDRGFLDDFVSWVDKRNQTLAKEYEGAGDFIPGLISKQDLALLAPNLTFSGTSMAATVAGAAAGAITPVPGAAVVGGMTAGGLAAHRMQSYQAMNSWLEKKNEESIKQFGRPINPEEEANFRKTFEPLATKSGLWEAGPEAVGNILELALMMGKATPVGRVAAMLPKGITGKLVKKAAEVGGILGTELGTETVTQMGQQQAEAKAGMTTEQARNWTSGDDWLKSAKEVLPQVLLLTGVMGAGGATYQRINKNVQEITVRQGNIKYYNDLGAELQVGDLIYSLKDQGLPDKEIARRLDARIGELRGEFDAANEKKASSSVLAGDETKETAHQETFPEVNAAEMVSSLLYATGRYPPPTGEGKQALSLFGIGRKKGAKAAAGGQAEKTAEGMKEEASETEIVKTGASSKAAAEMGDMMRHRVPPAAAGTASDALTPGPVAGKDAATEENRAIEETDRKRAENRKKGEDLFTAALADVNRENQERLETLRLEEETRKQEEDRRLAAETEAQSARAVAAAANEAQDLSTQLAGNDPKKQGVVADVLGLSDRVLAGAVRTELGLDVQPAGQDRYEIITAKGPEAVTIPVLRRTLAEKRIRDLDAVEATRARDAEAVRKRTAEAKTKREKETETWALQNARETLRMGRTLTRPQYDQLQTARDRLEPREIELLDAGPPVAETAGPGSLQLLQPTTAEGDTMPHRVPQTEEDRAVEDHEDRARGFLHDLLADGIEAASQSDTGWVETEEGGQRVAAGGWISALVRTFGRTSTTPLRDAKSNPQTLNLSKKYLSNVIDKARAGEDLTDQQDAVYREILREAKDEEAHAYTLAEEETAALAEFNPEAFAAEKKPTTEEPTKETVIPYSEHIPEEKAIINDYNKKMDSEEWVNAYENKEDVQHFTKEEGHSPLADELILDLDREGLAKDANILEIGSGQGRDGIYLAEKGHTVKGIDVSEKAVKIANDKAKGTKASFEVGDAENLYQFENESQDAVYSVAALHSTPIIKTFAEIFGVLKPGGIAKLFLYTRTKTGIKWISYWTPGEIKKYAEDAGFKIEKFREGHDTEPIQIPGVEGLVEQETHIVVTTLRKPKRAKAPPQSVALLGVRGEKKAAEKTWEPSSMLIKAREVWKESERVRDPVAYKKYKDDLRAYTVNVARELASQQNIGAEAWDIAEDLIKSDKTLSEVLKDYPELEKPVESTETEAIIRHFMEGKTPAADLGEKQKAFDDWAAKYPDEAKKYRPEKVAPAQGVALATGQRPVTAAATTTPAAGVKSLADLGLKVTQSTTNTGKAVWNVSGNTREHMETIKKAGGRWYGPRKVWSFYNGDPTAALAEAFGIKPGAEKAEARAAETPAQFVKGDKVIVQHGDKTYPATVLRGGLGSSSVTPDLTMKQAADLDLGTIMQVENDRMRPAPSEERGVTLSFDQRRTLVETWLNKEEWPGKYAWEGLRDLLRDLGVESKTTQKLVEDARTQKDPNRDYTEAFQLAAESDLARWEKSTAPVPPELAKKYGMVEKPAPSLGKAAGEVAAPEPVTREGQGTTPATPVFKIGDTITDGLIKGKILGEAIIGRGDAGYRIEILHGHEKGKTSFISKEFAELVPAKEMYSVQKALIAPEQDAVYRKAVESGDMENAQKMVDEAAVAAGYNVGPIFHGTAAKPYQVMRTPAYFTDSPRLAEDYARDAEDNAYFDNEKARIVRVYLKMDNPLRIDATEGDFDVGYHDKLLNQASREGHDGLILENVRDNIIVGDQERTTTYTPVSPSQIKLADPVTYDNKGKIIPLSERFNEKMPDIRYSTGEAAPLIPTLADVQSIFKGQEVVQPGGENSPIYVKTQGGKYLTIENVTEISPDEAAFEYAHGEKFDKDTMTIAGSYGDGVARLARGVAGKWTLAHESLHFLEDSGILDSTDVSTLQDHIQDLVRDGKIETANKKNIGGAEDRANFLADALTKEKPQPDLIGKIITRVQEFLDRLIEAFGIRTVGSVVRAVESGRIFERSGAENKGGPVITQITRRGIPGTRQYAVSRAGQQALTKAAPAESLGKNAETAWARTVVNPVGKKLSRGLQMMIGKADPVYQEAINHFINDVREFWTPAATLPHGDQWLAARAKGMGEVAKAMRFIGQLHKKLEPLSDDIKMTMFKVLDGQIPVETLSETFTTETKVKGKIVREEMNPRELARLIRRRSDTIGQMMVDRGIITEEQFKKWEGKYIHYAYAYHILGEGASIAISNNGKLDLAETLRRNPNLTMEQRKQLGLIENAAIAVPMGMGKALTDIAKWDYMLKIAENPEWVWQPSIVSVPAGLPLKEANRGRTRRMVKMTVGGLVKEVDKYKEMARFQPTPEVEEHLKILQTALDKAEEASKNRPADFVQLPAGKSYGPLAGAYVRQTIYNDMAPVLGQINADMGKGLKAFFEVEAFAMSTFKMGKVALNWPTAFRNVISNILQINMSGRPLAYIPGDIVKACEAMLAHIKVQEMSKNGEKIPEELRIQDQYYEEAFGMALFNTSWAATEINAVLDEFRKAEGGRIDKVLVALKEVAKLYGKIDDISKFTIFLQQRKEGKSIDAAAVHALKWGMDYSLASRSVKAARRHLIPFGSYSYKIAPLIAETLRDRPWVLAKYAMILPLMLTAWAKSVNDLDDDDVEELEKQLPTYIKKSGSMMLMPYKTAKGQYQWLNAEYFLPWSNIFNIFRDIKAGDIGELTRDLGITHPLIDLLTTVRSAREGTPPTHPFFGKPIYNELDPAPLKVAKMAEHIAFTFAPTMLSPSHGALGTTFEAAFGKEDRWGREVTPAQALGKWFGFTIIAVSPEQTAAIAGVKIQDKKKELARIEADPSISEERKKNYRMNLQEEIAEVAGESPEAVLPIRKQKGDDPVYNALVEMVKNGTLKSGPPSRSIEIAGVPYKMTNAQYREYLDRSSEIAHRKLEGLVASPAWATMRDKRKTEVVSHVMENARKGVRQKIKAEIARTTREKTAAARTAAGG